MVLVVAHRACPKDAPENSVAGVRAAQAAFVARRHRGTPTPLPTLEDALDQLPPGLGVALDCKDDRAVGAAAALVAARGIGPRTMVWARSAGAVAEARSRFPGSEVALLRDTRDEATTLQYVRDAHASGATQVSVHQRRISRRVVDEAESLGIFVFVWVVQRGAHEAALATGVHGVVTDWQAIARSLLG
jgi:glycerophosphoryl diester phosphodiesterase